MNKQAEVSVVYEVGVIKAEIRKIFERLFLTPELGWDSVMKTIDAKTYLDELFFSLRNDYFRKWALLDLFENVSEKCNKGALLKCETVGDLARILRSLFS